MHSKSQCQIPGTYPHIQERDWVPCILYTGNINNLLVWLLGLDSLWSENGKEKGERWIYYKNRVWLKKYSLRRIFEEVWGFLQLLDNAIRTVLVFDCFSIASFFCSFSPTVVNQFLYENTPGECCALLPHQPTITQELAHP